MPPCMQISRPIITGSRESWDGRVPTVTYDLEAKKVLRVFENPSDDRRELDGCE